MIMPAVVGIVLYILLFCALWWFIRPDLGDATQKKDFAQLMAQIAGGLALLFGLYFTWRRVEISQRTLETQQDQQVTERFTRAIDQLGATDDEGKPRVEIRLGGIYALERIAKDSPERDYSTIVDVLNAYVRENARRTLEAERQAHAEARRIIAKEGDEGLDKEQEEPPRLPADIQAVLDVLKRLREDLELQEYFSPLDLRNTNLQGANLRQADFEGARLEGANLKGVNLLQADLSHTFLWRADLKEAYLEGANLEGAHLKGANLERAWLFGANLFYTELQEANLEEAVIQQADLEGARLEGANLKGARFEGANLKGVDLSRAKQLTYKQIWQAIGDDTTELPEYVERPKKWTEGESNQSKNE